MTAWSTPTTTEDLDNRQLADEVVFIGQTHLKVQVEPFLDQTRMPHVLLTGDPGMGKTQFGKWIAWRREKPFFKRLSPVKAENLPPYGIVLLDEVHNQRRVEDLFPIMDEGLLTIVAATTKPRQLDDAFRSRFLIQAKLRPYTATETEQVLIHMLEDTEVTKDVTVLAGAADGHPRTAERIARTSMALGTTDPALVLQAVRITADGMTDDHFDYLGTLFDSSRPMGVAQIATLVMSSNDEVQRLERRLLTKGYVELTPSGRKLTIRGRQFVQKMRDDGVMP